VKKGHMENYPVDDIDRAVMAGTIKVYADGLCIHGVDPERCNDCYTSSAKIYAKGSRPPLNTEPKRHVRMAARCEAGDGADSQADGGSVE
jgi:hypothetical protein